MPLSSSQSKVCFFFEHSNFTLRDRSRLKLFIEKIFKKEGKRIQYINYIFCSDKRLLEINQQYLKHDFYTDIITFDLSESASIEAEIYISVDRVRANAVEMNIPFSDELLRVIFHGALHLCGFYDKNVKEKAQMREKEDLLISKYKA